MKKTEINQLPTMGLAKKTVLSAIFLAAGAGAVLAGTTTGNNFSMVHALGGGVGGANDVVFTWDGSLRTSEVTDDTSNATLTSVTPFFGSIWTAHHINIYGPGTYVFDTSCAAGNPSCGDGGSDLYTLTVPSGYLGAHMLFNWSVSSNIDVVQLWKFNDSWSGTADDTDPFDLTIPNLNSNTASTVWSLVSIDTSPATAGTPIVGSANENNLWHGTVMIDGPFVGYSANFNVMLNKNPSAFSFTDQSNVVASTLTESNAITVTGTDGTQTEVYLISVTNGEYSIDSGSYTSTSGTVVEGQTVKVRNTSSATTCWQVTTDLNIGGTSGSFTTTTTGAGCTDTTPNQFILTDQIGVAQSTVIESNSITVTGIDGSPATTAISVSGGEYSVNGGAYTSTAGTVQFNDTVTVRHTSAADYETSASTVLTIGGISDTFTTTTAASTTVTVDAKDPPKMPGSGCSISSKSVSATAGADWWLVAGFLAWLGALRMRFRRQTQS